MYKTGTETKNQIIQSASKFFYEKGVQKTTFTDIEKDCGINKGLIHYYFGSKDGLIMEIYFNAVEQNNMLAAQLVQDETETVLNILGTRIHYYRAFYDKKYRNFALTATQNLCTTHMSSYMTSVLGYIRKLGGLSSEQDDTIYLRLTLLTGMECALIGSLNEYAVDHSIEDIWRFYEDTVIKNCMEDNSSYAEASHHADELCRILPLKHTLVPLV